jgi:preprotein translocase subunit YajC
MNNTVFTIAYILVFIAIFYFLLIRPQQKQRKQRNEMMSNLNVGDKIYTAGGILGTITMLKEETLWVKVADKVEIQILKSSVGGLQSDDRKE